MSRRFLRYWMLDGKQVSTRDVREKGRAYGCNRAKIEDVVDELESNGHRVEKRYREVERTSE